MNASRLFMTGILALLGSSASAVTLESCIATALERNPTIEAATYRIEAAAAATVEARAGYLPTITLSGAYTRTDNPAQAFFMNLNQRQATLENDFNRPDDTGNLRWSAGVKWMLLDGGQRGLSTRMARLRERSSEDRLRAARNELIYQVTRSFYQLLQSRENLRVQQATLQRVEESLRVARARYDAGSALKTDVLHLDVLEAEAREQELRASHAVELSITALNLAVGETMVTADTALTVPDAGTLPVRPDDLALDLHRRPEWQALQREDEAGKLAAQRTRRENLPRLSAFGSSDWDSDASSDYGQSYFAGAMLEWDLFTGYRNRARTAAATAESMEIAARRRELEQQLQLEWQQAYLNTREAHQRIDVTVRALESAGEAYRITRARYEEGAADITELLTAQVGLASSETRHLNATYDYLLALANLKRASGESETTP